MCAQVFLTPTHLAIAMEYAQGGDLFNYTLGHRPHGRLAEQQARWIFQQLIIGLDYSHRRVNTSFYLFKAYEKRVKIRSSAGFKTSQEMTTTTTADYPP